MKTQLHKKFKKKKKFKNNKKKNESFINFRQQKKESISLILIGVAESDFADVVAGLEFYLVVAESEFAEVVPGLEFYLVVAVDLLDTLELLRFVHFVY